MNQPRLSFFPHALFPLPLFLCLHFFTVPLSHSLLPISPTVISGCRFNGVWWSPHVSAGSLGPFTQLRFDSHAHSLWSKLAWPSWSCVAKWIKPVSNSMCTAGPFEGLFGRSDSLCVSFKNTHISIYDIKMPLCMSLPVKPIGYVTWVTKALLSFSMQNTHRWDPAGSFLPLPSQYSICLLLSSSFLSSLHLLKIYVVSNNHILTHNAVWNYFPWTIWGALFILLGFSTLR